MVLVAEDSEPVLGVLSEILARAGAEVGGCADPRDALAALEEDPASWDLLVTDFDMPGLTGAELARAARRAAPGLAVLLCTALPDWRGRDAAAAELFDAVTAKPVREAALLSAAARAIARRQSREDLPCVS
jgi:CheY-like chemotaxis protein